MGPRLPAFAPVARLRPITLARTDVPLGLAPYAAAEVDLPDGRPGAARLTSGDTALAATWDGTSVAITTAWDAGGERRHVGRRPPGRREAARRLLGSRPERPGTLDGLALTLTGPRATAWSRSEGTWVARTVVDLDALPGAPDVHDEHWLVGLRGVGDRVGGFGQIGLRDVRVVTNADGTPHRPAGEPVLLSATSAGPGGFRTAHTSVWALDTDTLELEHRADLYFRRPPGSPHTGVYGDHATHLLRDGDRWLAATSTWGTFEPPHPTRDAPPAPLDCPSGPRVTTTLAVTTADVVHGCHVLDTVPLALPTGGLASVGTWDPHLVRTDDGWLAAYVSARRFFSFHPVVASGPTLEALSLRAAATTRTATEGPTLTCIDGSWWVLASDGRDSWAGPETEPATYPVLDLDLRRHGVLDAHYPTNIPWPTIVADPTSDDVEQALGSLLIGFDAAPYGGRLPGYGSHGEVVVQRSR